MFVVCVVVTVSLVVVSGVVALSEAVVTVVALFVTGKAVVEVVVVVVVKVETDNSRKMY